MTEEMNGAAAPEECTHHCDSCGVAGCGDRTTEPSTLETNANTTIKNVISVVSGKGGVGKSLVTGLLATELVRRGYKVGILDADVTGPCIPKIFGITDRPGVDEQGLIPVKTSNGVTVMSVNLLLPEGDIPVAWRGPVISGILTQFWNQVSWGDLDVLLIDMPPGTSDVFLTIFHQLPVDGIITVSSPQDLVAMIVGKAVNLAGDMDKPVLGLVENMAYFVCDECGKKHYIYGEPQGAEIAAKYDIPSHAELPIDPQFAAMTDEGRIAEYEVGDALDPVLAQIEKVLKA